MESAFSLKMQCPKSFINRYIMQKSPCNIDPLTPHFYIVKNWVYRGMHVFLIFALNHRLWALVRTASMRRFLRVPTINVLIKNKKNIKIVHLKMNIFTAVKYCCILYGRVCVILIRTMFFRVYILLERGLVLRYCVCKYHLVTRILDT